GLRLDTARGALQGGNAGPAVVPGKSDASRLIHAVTGTHNVVAMPPKGKPRLSTAEIALLKRWIDDGAHAPANEVAETVTPRRNPGPFQAPKPRVPPPAKDEKWVRTPTARFTPARLEKEGLRPSPEADRAPLTRRVSLDLTGLPPTPA